MTTPSRRIHTARLTLAPHGLADFEACFTLWSDADVTRFVAAKPLTREETWARFLRYAGCWSLFGYGFWTVRETASGRPLGEIGFANNGRDIDPPLEEPEIGWGLLPWAQGQGYAAEAVAAALAWADTHLADAGTTCIIAEGHDRSERIAAAAGYKRLTVAPYHGRSFTIFRRPRPPAGPLASD